MSNFHELRVSVCVCTYKRPHLLHQLLESLAAQTFKRSDFEVVVVDNETAGSARSTIDAFARENTLPIVRYEIEPQQGISYARNRTVALAKGALLAFIDDDELAEPNWLEDMVSCLFKYSADAVLGPVIPTYPLGTADWVVQSHFFDRPRFVTGSVLSWGDGRCGNALILRKLVQMRGPQPFAIELAHSGGEDTDFFRWAVAQEAKLVWCDSAVVSEAVPGSRQKLRFMLERSFRTSVTYWRPLFAQRSAAWRFVKALFGLAGGITYFSLGLLLLPFGAGRTVAAWCKGLKAFGRIAAISDFNLVGYRK